MNTTEKKLLGPLLSGEYMVTDHSYRLSRSTSVITGELRRLDGLDLVRMDLKFYAESSRDGRLDMGGRYRITVEPIKQIPAFGPVHDHASYTEDGRKAPPVPPPPAWVMKAARARWAWGKHQDAKAAEIRNGTMNRDVWDSFAEFERVLTAEHGYLRDALVLAKDPLRGMHARADALVIEEENAPVAQTAAPKAALVPTPQAVGDAELEAALRNDARIAAQHEIEALRHGPIAFGTAQPPRTPFEDLIGTLIRLLDRPTGAIAPYGCICPPTAERDCRSPYCPRNPPQPMVAR